MPYDRFIIAPLNTGLETDLKPWLIPDDAFAQLTNAYIFRGRVRKRFGSRLMGSGWATPVEEPLFSRFRINLGNTDGSGDFGPSVIPGSLIGTTTLGMQFSIGAEIFTVYQAIAGSMLDSTGLATVKTFDPATGTVTINGAAAATAVWFYPSLPVMGLANYQVGGINDQPSYGFDPRFAYVFAGGFWQRSGAVQFHGTNSDFFWTDNWIGLDVSDKILFVTNFFVTSGTGTLNDDPIWYFDGTTWFPFSYSPSVALNPTNQQPYTVTQTTNSTGDVIKNYVQSSLIIASFKNRLVLLNTIENNANGATAWDPMNPTTTGITPANYVTSTNTQYPARARFCHFGSPFSDSAWLEKNQVYNNGGAGLVQADGGGFIDAATDEAITSAEFIKDRLIVYFEQSTWELVYTGNQVNPFTWQKINTELGSEATFSTVPFDKQILTIGNTGVHSCNGQNVERIDNRIPDQIFAIQNRDEGVARVVGIRDYYTEMVYWTFPQSDERSFQFFPNRVLVYNYKNGAWAFNEDCITFFGYFEQQPGQTWVSTTSTWEESGDAWASGAIQSNFRQVIAGNQQGYVFIVDAEESRNARNQTITNMTNAVDGIQLTVINHTLTSGGPNQGDYIIIENAQGVGLVNDTIFLVVKTTAANTITVNTITDGEPTFPAAHFTGTYTGGGTLSRVSNIEILSKQWNPYVEKARDVYIAKIDFGVQKTSDGKMTIDYLLSSSNALTVEDAIETETIVGTSVLETSPYPSIPFEFEQTRLWHPVYLQAEGECVQIFIWMNPDQITDLAIAFSDFQLEGLILFTMPTTSRLQ